LMRHPDSITGQCLREKKTFPSRGKRRTVSPEDQHLVLRNAAVHNLKNLTVRFPLNRLVVVTGVSGSGKSTLVRECLLPAVQAVLKRGSAKTNSRTTNHAPRVTGHESIQSVHEVDQSPIGRTPRSVPSTYVGFFNDIRTLFAQ